MTEVENWTNNIASSEEIPKLSSLNRSILDACIKTGAL